MSAEDLLREANIRDALASLKEQVRSSPADAKLRVFLFQLFAIDGQWERALAQLNVAADLDPAALAMAQMYREAIRCEVLREAVFRGQRSPMVFGEPPEWIGSAIEALRLNAESNHEAADALRNAAFEAAPATAGSIDGTEFTWIADADSRLGPILEIIVNGKYYWAPFANIQRITVIEPEDLRDFVWAPVHFVWTNQGEAVGLIPTRYPGLGDDDQERLAKKTTWHEIAPNVFAGAGQRMLTTDVDEYALLDVREIQLRDA